MIVLQRDQTFVGGLRRFHASGLSGFVYGFGRLFLIRQQALTNLAYSSDNLSAISFGNVCVTDIIGSAIANRRLNLVWLKRNVVSVGAVYVSAGRVNDTVVSLIFPSVNIQAAFHDVLLVVFFVGKYFGVLEVQMHGHDVRAFSSLQLACAIKVFRVSKLICYWLATKVSGGSKLGHIAHRAVINGLLDFTRQQELGLVGFALCFRQCLVCQQLLAYLAQALN